MMAAKKSAKVPVLRDWKEEDDYAFTRELDEYGWAWEFLRRNPEYREDWERALEDWKRNPEANMEAWSNRPTTLYPVRQPSPRGTSPDDPDFMVYSGDSMEKWHLTHYVNPDRDSLRDPGILFFLNWSVQASSIVSEEPGHLAAVLPPPARPPTPNTTYEEDAVVAAVDRPFVPPFHAAVLFDLRYPIKPQIKRARSRLVLERKTLKEETGAKVLRPASRGKKLWAFCLRLLDADASEASISDVGKQFDFDPLDTEKELSDSKIYDRLVLARRLMTPDGYLNTLLPRPFVMWTSRPIVDKKHA